MRTGAWTVAGGLGVLAWIVVASATLTGCVPGDVSLEDKRCPCAQGWVCDELRDVCVRGDAPDGGGMDGDVDMDGGMDAPMRDTGTVDAGPDDAGTMDDAGGDDAGGDDAGGDDAGGDDAGAMDGSTDAGVDSGVDAGPDETACDEALSDAWLCEDFELPSLSGWYIREKDGTAERVTSMAYRGEGALRATTTAGSGRAVIDSTPVPDVSSGDMYLRAYYYVPSSVTLDSFNVMYTGTDETPYVGIGAGLRGATGEPAVWVGPDSSGYRATGFETPRDRWFCAQVHILVSDTEGVVEVSIDGTLVESWTGLDTLGPAGYGGFSVGLEWTSPEQSSATLYVDEAAIGDSPLPCD